MSTQNEEREAKLREIAKKQVTYRLSTMDTVVVRNTACGERPMDIYYPAEPQPNDRLPVVVVAAGYPDPEGRIRYYGPMTSWARLIAASGMAAVIYGPGRPAEDIHAVVRHLRENAPALSIDDLRVGLFTTSGNVPVALSALMRDNALACAALLYGYTMDLPGSTAIADASAQFGFVNACAGKSVDDLPATVPLFLVRAGREQFPGLNAALDGLVAAMLARNLPVTFINHATGAHGFDLDEDTDLSRQIVQEALSFLVKSLA